MIRGNVILTRVPENILVSPVSTTSAFLGATSPIPSSRHVFTLGILRSVSFLPFFISKIKCMMIDHGLPLEKSNE
jgi:raffinose synthase